MDDFVNRFQGLCIGDEGAVGHQVSSDLASEGLSVSVRSDGYLKLSQPGESHGAQTQTSSLSTMKVIVNGGKKEEDALNLEVYDMGMWKTELCNKWEEMGASVYGDHCQFAHGMEELHPVIRNPRYKTDQGAGKSAVLNSLTGYPILPMGANGATQAPISIDLQKDGSLSSKAIILQIDSALRHSLQERLSKGGLSKGRDEIYLKLPTSTAPSLKLVDLPCLDQRIMDDLTQQQKVIVNGGKKEEVALNLVYNLGMWKTELFSKWQETEASLYGDHCPFAHGMEQLRPVIHHLRYKTEVHRKYKHKHQQTRYTPYQIKRNSTLKRLSQDRKEEDKEDKDDDDEKRRVRDGKKTPTGRPVRKPPIGMDLVLTYHPSNNEELENLTIHGGWPRGSGARSSASLHPRRGMKNKAPKYDFSPDEETERLMHQYWPSIKNDMTDEEFWRHEWEEHGTSSEETCDLYFNLVRHTGIEVIEELRPIMDSLTHGQVINTRNFYQTIINESGVRPFLDIRIKNDVPELQAIHFYYTIELIRKSYPEEECEVPFENFTVCYGDIE